jgi:acetyl-CoA C-acetyltransferase
VMALAFDPIINRPLRFNPHAIAGLEMASFMQSSGIEREDCARVVSKNRAAALKNPNAAFPAKISPQEVLRSADSFSPLKKMEMSAFADGATVIVLASARKARELSDNPVWIDGAGWINDTPTLENREWPQANYASLAAKMASRQAGYSADSVDLYEIDDTYAYKELQHAEALGICSAAEYWDLVDGCGMPVNVSGGSLGCGHVLDSTGLFKLGEATAQLRGEAGRRQVKEANRALVQSWRGVPTTSGAVLLMSNNNGGEKK